jgi:hypothetical protein
MLRGGWCHFPPLRESEDITALRDGMILQADEFIGL